MIEITVWINDWNDYKNDNDLSKYACKVLQFRFSEFYHPNILIMFIVTLFTLVKQITIFESKVLSW